MDAFFAQRWVAAWVDTADMGAVLGTVREGTSKRAPMTPAPMSTNAARSSIPICLRPRRLVRLSEARFSSRVMSGRSLVGPSRSARAVSAAVICAESGSASVE